MKILSILTLTMFASYIDAKSVRITMTEEQVEKKIAERITELREEIKALGMEIERDLDQGEHLKAFGKGFDMLYKSYATEGVDAFLRHGRKVTEKRARRAERSANKDVGRERRELAIEEAMGDKSEAEIDERRASLREKEVRWALRVAELALAEARRDEKPEAEIVTLKAAVRRGQERLDNIQQLINEESSTEGIGTNACVVCDDDISPFALADVGRHEDSNPRRVRRSIRKSSSSNSNSGSR